MPVEKHEVVKRYEQDPSVAYYCSDKELNILLSEVGEMEPIVDAILKRNGASKETRAAAIGCSPDDFWGEDNQDFIIEMSVPDPDMPF